MWRKSYYLASGISQVTLSAVSCVMERVSADCLWASWCFLVLKGQVQSYKGKHCSLVGIQYINIKTGHLRASALTKYNHQRKNK